MFQANILINQKSQFYKSSTYIQVCIHRAFCLGLVLSIKAGGESQINDKYEYRGIFCRQCKYMHTKLNHFLYDSTYQTSRSFGDLEHSMTLNGLPKSIILMRSFNSANKSASRHCIN